MVVSTHLVHNIGFESKDWTLGSKEMLNNKVCVYLYISMVN